MEKVEASSSSEKLATKTPGRQTKTALKAAYLPTSPLFSGGNPRPAHKPPLPPSKTNPPPPHLPPPYTPPPLKSTGVLPPTLPPQSSPTSGPRLPSLHIPSISQLRDFPNLFRPHRIPVVSPTLGIPLPTLNVIDEFSPDAILHCEQPLIPLQAPLQNTPQSEDSPIVGSWDYYQEHYTDWNLSFQQVDQTPCPGKIPIIITDQSDLEESFTTSSHTPTNSPLFEEKDIPERNFSSLLEEKTHPENNIMQAASEEVDDLEADVRGLIDLLDPDEITEASAPAMQGDLDKVFKNLQTYRKTVKKFLKTYAVDGPNKEALEEKGKVLIKYVGHHRSLVNEKVAKLLPVVKPLSEFEQETINIQKRQLHLQEQTLQAKKDEAVATAKPLKTQIIFKCSDLTEELDKYPALHLPDKDDQTIQKVMLKLSAWKTKMDQIESMNQEFETRTAIHKLSVQDHQTVKSAIATAKTSLEELNETAEQEDDQRQLFSLDTSSRIEQVKWPTFSGECGEDFFKFKKDFEDASKQNKTSSRNQISKLRENLRGYAKSLIPDSIEDITRALDILRLACGDSMKVVNKRVENLMNVGPWPTEGTKDCYVKQVKWVVRVQTSLQEIIDLAKTNEELGAVIFNGEKLAQILRLFPPFLVDKVSKIPGYKEDKFKIIIDKLEETKSISQNREKVYGAGGQPGKNLPVGNHSPPPQTLPQLPPGHVTFPAPKQYPDCRICEVLQSQGEAEGLFEGHVSDYPTGCPNFAVMGTDQRVIICKEARICYFCMGKKAIANLEHGENCPVKKKKHTYSCKDTNCKFHMWLCTRHTETNKPDMERLEEQLRTKNGITLVYMAQKGKKVVSPTTGSINQGQSVPLSTSPPVSSVTTHSVYQESSIKSAVRKMVRYNKKVDPNIETVKPPEGVPIFMFLEAEGLHNPVNIFFDNGCTDAIFKSEIPGNELKGTLVNKGPFQMGGVGDIVTMADDEWLVQLNRTDGKKQLVKGVTMKQITCDFPRAETSEVAAEIKALKSNPSLQNCSLPKVVGGTVHVLLGIRYSNIAPVPLHQFDCGLVVYQTRLTAHDRYVNCIIGGPHTSFKFLADKVGNVQALLGHFTAGLKKVRQFGPPPIPNNPISWEEDDFSLFHNAQQSIIVQDYLDQESKEDHEGIPCKDRDLKAFTSEPATPNKSSNSDTDAGEENSESTSSEQWYSSTMSSFNLKMAPLLLPIQRCLETFAVFFFLAMVLFLGISTFCDGSEIIDGVTRLSCEVGVPKFMVIDHVTNLIKPLHEVETDVVNNHSRLHTEYGEKRIRTIQESLAECGLDNTRLHATSLQTLLKLEDNTELLKMLTPNMLRVHRSNEISLYGSIIAYGTWFIIWSINNYPKLIFQPKWLKQDRDLDEDGKIGTTTANHFVLRTLAALNIIKHCTP